MAEDKQESAGKDSKPARVIAPLDPARMKLAEFGIVNVCVYVPSGVEPEDMLSVAFWSNVATVFGLAKQKGECFIEAFADDGRWYARFLVREAGRNWAKVSLLSQAKLEPVDISKRIAIVPGHTVSHGGAFAKWRVVRDTDQKVLRDKFATEGDAYAWLTEYAKGLAA